MLRTKVRVRKDGMLEARGRIVLFTDADLSAPIEEADKLITSCGKRLNDAERKIEMLIKNRNGELVVGADQKPQTKMLNND